MNVFKTLGILCMLGVATLLAGCNLSAESNVSDSKQFQTICRNESLGYSIWTLIASQTTVSPEIKLRVDQAHSIVRTNCANPPSDIPTALIAIADAFRIIQTTTGEIQASAARKT